MGESREKRSRALRLTEEALELIVAKIEITRGGGQRARASYGWISSRTELSPATVRRILERTGNDRAVLVHLFKCFGVPWSEAYLERIPKEEPVQIPEVAHDAPKARNPSKLALVVVALTVVSLIALLLVSLRREPVEPLAVYEKGYELYGAGKYDEALELAEQVIEWGTDYRRIDRLVDGLRLRGDIFIAQGRLDEARETFLTALPLCRTIQYNHAKGTIEESLGNLEGKLGNLEAAEEYFSEAMKTSALNPAPGAAAGVMRSLGSLAGARGDVKQARKWYEATIVALGERPADDPFYIGLDGLNALLLCQEGKYDEAVKRLETCLAYWRRKGHTRWIAGTSLQLGSVFAEAGNNGKARELISEACKLFKLAGDNQSARVCDEWLKARDTISRKEAIWFELYF